MKNYIKKNISIFSIFFLLLFWGFICVAQYNKENTFLIKDQEKMVEMCKNGTQTISIDDCNNYYKEELKQRDVISTLGYILNFYSISIINIISPLLIIVASIWQFHKYMRGNCLKNALTRISYKDYFLKNYRFALKAAFIIPIFLVTIFLLSFLISKNFDYDYTIETYTTIWGSNNLQKGIELIIMFVLNIFLHSIFWINLGIINVKKNRSVFVSIIAGYLIYLVLFVVIETIIGTLIFGNTSYEMYFNLAIIFSYGDINIYGVLIQAIILVIISSFILFMTYKNKEQVIIDSER